MIINSLASIWHHLKHNRNDELLNALCALGHAREAESYIKTWDVDEKQAKAFAQRMEYAIGNSSQVYGGTPPKAEPSMPAAVSKKIFYALLVDDQEEMYDRLAQELWKVNQDNPEYELRLRYVPDVQRAESALDGPGLQAIILDYLLTESDFSGSTQPGTASVKLSKIIAERRPGLAVFGLTGFVPHRTTAGDTTAWNATNSDWQVQRVFFKHDPAEVHELLRAVVHSVRQRASTPFFSSLKQYSEWPTTVFHALPLSRSKSVAASQWAKEFAQFYGEHYRRPGLRRAQLALF